VTNFFLVGFVRRFFLQECILAVQGHPVIDFGINLKCVCEFLLARHSNLGLHQGYYEVTVSEILQVFAFMTPPLFHANFAGDPI